MPRSAQASDEPAQLASEGPSPVRRGPLRLGQPGHDGPGAAEHGQPIGDVPARSDAKALEPFVRAHRAEVVLGEEIAQGFGLDRRKPGQLDRPIAGRGDRAQRAGEILRRELAERVELDRDLVRSHDAEPYGMRVPRVTRRVPYAAAMTHRCRSTPRLPLGVGIVGCGNIAGPYAREPRRPRRDPAGRRHRPRSGARDGVRGRARLPRARLARRAAGRPRGRARRQPDRPPRPLRGHASRPSRPAGTSTARSRWRSRPTEARELVELAARRGVRLACAPSTFLGEAQQTVGAIIKRGELGTVRAVYADVNWGRIETWHPAPIAVLRRRRAGRRRRLPADARDRVPRPGGGRSRRAAGSCSPTGSRPRASATGSAART